jgi:predicted O-methyltransferase YrrM
MGKGDLSRTWSALDAMLRAASEIAPLRDRIDATLTALEAHPIFSFPQALTLTAAVFDFDPDIIVDLGTGCGGSSCTLAIAARGRFANVCTFDINPNWTQHVQPRLPPGDWSGVRPIIADITKYDFTPLLDHEDRILVFLDAHGFEIAARLLSHILPLIAEKPHLVFCHDISDNRMWDTDEARSYGGRKLWRGTAHYFANMATTAQINIDWMTTAGEQALAIYDFCYRNRIALRSVDQDVHLQGSPDDKSRLQALLFPMGLPIFHLSYFTLNNTESRNFPAG